MCCMHKQSFVNVIKCSERVVNVFFTYLWYDYYVHLTMITLSDLRDRTFHNFFMYLKLFNVPFMMFSRTYWLKFVIFLRFEQSKNFTSKNTRPAAAHKNTRQQSRKNSTASQHRILRQIFDQMLQYIDDSCAGLFSSIVFGVWHGWWVSEYSMKLCAGVAAKCS